MTKWLKRLCDYWNDKKLAEKCGLKVKDICVHERDGHIYYKFKNRYEDEKLSKCKKCGEFYR